MKKMQNAKGKSQKLRGLLDFCLLHFAFCI